MNKQELIEALKAECNECHPLYSFSIRTGFERAIEMVEELLEPTEAEPLIVPKEVGGGGMKKSYVVRYYIDYKNHGIDVIFSDKEVAEEHAKMMTEQDEDINCHYSVYEEIVYNPFDERRGVRMNPIQPPHYRKGDIDLYESWYLTRPFAEFRAIMESIAERYMKRDKINRLEDIDKCMYTLQRLREYEVLHAKEAQE